MLVSFHATYTASGMFLTGMAANPLIADFARKIAHVDLTWVRWLEGSIVPALLTLTLVPLLLHRLVRPAITDTAPARAHAGAALRELGRMKQAELWLVVVMLGVMAGWVTSPRTAFPMRSSPWRGSPRSCSPACSPGTICWPSGGPGMP